MSAGKAGARVRAEAAKVVDAVVSNGRSLDVALAAAQVSAADRPLLKMLSYGVLRFHWRLRSQIAQLLERPLKSRDSVVEALISVGLYQLTDTRIPDHAAVSVTVEAARLLRRPKYAGLINAVLRNFGRRKLGLREPANEEERYNHPAWLIAQIRADWPEHWRPILEANNERAPMWLRVNRRRVATKNYLQQLKEAGNEDSSLLPGFDQAVCLGRPEEVEALPGFSEGFVSVQDAAAQIAAAWLLADGGEHILDACAAPGGKTGHLLELARVDGALTAIDQDEHRLEAVRENLARLGLGATVLSADASNPQAWWDGQPFDRILLDAPCSASGVIRRHPDIKLLRRADDLAQMAAVQAAMLAALWPLLRPSGKLLYVTCSVLQQENDAVVLEFLGQHEDARENRALPNNNIRDLMVRKACGFQVLPGTAGLDGFYFACLEKTCGTQDKR